MASKHVQIYLTLVVITAMQNKTTMKFHYTLTIMVINKKIITSVEKDMKKLESSYIADQNKNGITTLENSLAISLKAKHKFTTYTSNYSPMNLPKRNTNICLVSGRQVCKC